MDCTCVYNVICALQMLYDNDDDDGGDGSGSGDPSDDLCSFMFKLTLFIHVW